MDLNNMDKKEFLRRMDVYDIPEIYYADYGFYFDNVATNMQTQEYISYDWLYDLVFKRISQNSLRRDYITKDIIETLADQVKVNLQAECEYDLDHGVFDWHNPYPNLNKYYQFSDDSYNKLKQNFRLLNEAKYYIQTECFLPQDLALKAPLTNNQPTPFSDQLVPFSEFDQASFNQINPFLKEPVLLLPCSAQDLYKTGLFHSQMSCFVVLADLMNQPTETMLRLKNLLEEKENDRN